MTPEEFTSYMRSAPPPSEMEGEPMREAYRYAKVYLAYVIICHPVYPSSIVRQIRHAFTT